MQETVLVALRMRDVGFALSAAKGYGVSLNRIALQKLVYIADSLSLIFQLLPPASGHQTYKHGPYDRFIQNAVDSLCFRELAAITKAVQFENSVSTEYALTDSGSQWIAELGTRESSADRKELFSAVAYELQKNENWSRLKELVYAEPTFVATRPLGWGKPLQVDDGRRTSSAALLQTIGFALKHGSTKPPSRSLVVTLFMRYLDRYAISQRKWV